jgi:hypothetical protein
MLLNSLLAVLLAGTAAAAPSTLASDRVVEATLQVCPPEVPGTRAIAERFLTHHGLAAERKVVGATRTAPLRGLRVLNDTQDTAACTFFNSHLGAGGQDGEWRWSYYTDGYLYYIAAVRLDATGARRSGLVPFRTTVGERHNQLRFAAREVESAILCSRSLR